MVDQVERQLSDGKFRPKSLSSGSEEFLREKALTGEAEEMTVEARKTGARDSDFGLSERQLEHLRTHVQENSEEQLSDEEESKERCMTKVFSIMSDEDDPDSPKVDVTVPPYPNQVGGEPALVRDSDLEAIWDRFENVLQKGPMSPSADLVDEMFPNRLRSDSAGKHGRDGKYGSVMMDKVDLTMVVSLSQSVAVTPDAYRCPAPMPAIDEADDAAPACESLENFLKLNTEEHPSKSNWKVVVLSTKEIAGSTWHLLQVEDGDPRLCMKEHEELAQLDQDLQWICGHRCGVFLPTFPQQRQAPREDLWSWIGGSGDAEDTARQQAMHASLQRYFDDLVTQLPSPEDEPLLEEFFSREANNSMMQVLLVSTGVMEQPGVNSIQSSEIANSNGLVQIATFIES